MAYLRAFPKSGGGYHTEVIPESSLSHNSYYTINCGFAPKYAVFYVLNGNSSVVVQYWDIDAHTILSTFPTSYFEVDGSSAIGDNFIVDGNTIKYKTFNAAYSKQTRVIVVG